MPTETCDEAVNCSQSTQATKSNTGDCAPQAPTIFMPTNLDSKSENKPATNLVDENAVTQLDSHMYDAFVIEARQKILQKSLDNDKLFNSLLSSYINDFEGRQKQKRSQKKAFFVIIMIILFLVILGCFGMVACVIVFSQDIATSIAAISASIIEFSIAFLKLPQIVAKYLFNRDEDKAMTKTISRMQKYNLKRYNGSFKHKK
jgi:hypothetical protein